MESLSDRSVDKLDYSIRRWAIADHPGKTTDARLNELQRAIGRSLAAEYDPVLPDRLVALLRQIEQPA
jgi:hypothetical protein